MNEDRTVLVDNVQIKEGISQKNGKAYKRTVLAWKGEDGTEKFASAFGDGLFEHAKPLENQRAVITVEENGNFLDLVAVRPAPVDEPPAPALGTGDYVTGQKPAIEARRIFCSTAANQATQLTDMLMRHQTGREVTPELVRAAWDAMFDHVFNIITVRGDALNRGEDDFPF